MSQPTQLKRTLGPLMLWGLGVGYVISGMYFGWNLGLAKGGTLGLAIATFFIMIMYITFTFGYTELACAIPKAGGVFDYAKRALGKRWGFIGGMAQNIEFIFAPAAIALGIGAYVQNLVPTISVLWVAIVAYLIFTGVNIYGVKAAATVELLITVLAVTELLIFAGSTLPHIETANLIRNAFPNGYEGILTSIPFAIWFFLAIEGVANVAEETINPQRNVLLGFGSALATLIVLCILIFISSVGVDGWESVVYNNGAESDSPLPLALSKIYGQGHFLYHLVTTVGLFGLIASFHGIILAGGRATFEFGKFGYAPKKLGTVHPRFQTPAYALIANLAIGMIAVLTGKSFEIIIIASFGALTLYIISMISLLVLRKHEPNLERPFKVPFYPVFPIVALAISFFSLIAITIYYPLLAGIYFGLLVLSFLLFYFFVERKSFSNNS